MKKPKFGYHKKKIKKGTLGEISKIKEEILELEDALEQKNKIMALVELSDLFGAIKLYCINNDLTLNKLIKVDTNVGSLKYIKQALNSLIKSNTNEEKQVRIEFLIQTIKSYLFNEFNSISINDLKIMNDATARAFLIGHRKSK